MRYINVIAVIAFVAIGLTVLYWVKIVMKKFFDKK